MPSAITMLQEYRRQIAESRGAGLWGVWQQGMLIRKIDALLVVVDHDHDPRMCHQGDDVDTLNERRIASGSLSEDDL